MTTSLKLIKHVVVWGTAVTCKKFLQLAMAKSCEVEAVVRDKYVGEKKGQLRHGKQLDHKLCSIFVPMLWYYY